MCVEMVKMFLENVFIEQLLRMEKSLNTGSWHKNTKKHRNGQNVFKERFY